VNGTDPTDPIPRRVGPRPSTTAPGIPHQQLDQQPEDLKVREMLAAAVFALPGVAEEASGISVAGARALVNEQSDPTCCPTAFLIGHEFAHLHPWPDLSLHLTLPTADAEAVIEAGWGEWHPWVPTGRLPPTVVMVYAPRTGREAAVIESLVRRSWRFSSCS
jgi:hypothetical protein